MNPVLACFRLQWPSLILGVACFESGQKGNLGGAVSVTSRKHSEVAHERLACRDTRYDPSEHGDASRGADFDSVIASFNRNDQSPNQSQPRSDEWTSEETWRKAKVRPPRLAPRTRQLG